MGCASFSVFRGIGCVSSPPIIYVKIRLHLYSTSHGNNAISVNTSSSELLYVMVELLKGEKEGEKDCSMLREKKEE